MCSNAIFSGLEPAQDDVDIRSGLMMTNHIIGFESAKGLVQNPIPNSRSHRPRGSQAEPGLGVEQAPNGVGNVGIGKRFVFFSDLPR